MNGLSSKRFLLFLLVGVCLMASCRAECTIGTTSSGQPRARGEPEFGEIVLSHGIQGPSAAPTDDVEVFSTDDDVIYAVMQVDNLRSPVKFTARWYYVDEEIFNVSSDIQQDLIDTHVYSSLTPPGEFLKGDHSVEILFDDKLQGRKNFTVE